MSNPPFPVLQLSRSLHRAGRLYLTGTSFIELKPAWTLILYLLLKQRQRDRDLPEAMRGWLELDVLSVQYLKIADLIETESVERYANATRSTVNAFVKTGRVRRPPLMLRGKLGYKLAWDVDPWFPNVASEDESPPDESPPDESPPDGAPPDGAPKSGAAKVSPPPQQGQKNEAEILVDEEQEREASGEA